MVEVFAYVDGADMFNGWKIIAVVLGKTAKSTSIIVDRGLAQVLPFL